MSEQIEIKSLLTQFDLHQRLYNNVLSGFTDDECNRRLNGFKEVNHVKYIAGHILNSQYGIAAIAGSRPEVKWNDLFAVMGQSTAMDNITYPHIDEIKAEWNSMYLDVRDRLKSLTEEELNSKPQPPFDQVATSAIELLAFINHHQAYHIGQIAILRKAFGKKAMSYE
jgi:uncharacterized damage-inducible protein DinB